MSEPDLAAALRRLAARRPVAVIGAGIAGLAAARALLEAGLAPVVFEKSRGLGGRLATRRPDGRDSPLGVDHGAPAVHAPTARLLDEIAGLAGAAALRWRLADEPDRAALIGAPGMSDLVRPLAEGLTLRLGVEIAAAARGPEDWLLDDAAGGRHGPFAAVASAVPTPQAAALFGRAAVGPSARAYRPGLTAIVVFSEPLGLGADVVHGEGGPLGRAIRDSAKPGRGDSSRPDEEAWALHATDAAAAAHLERSKEEIAAWLLAAFAERIGRPLPAPRYLAGHRWRYAIAAGSADALPETPFVLDADAAGALLGFCGDGFAGPTAGHAYHSGRTLGAALAAALQPR